MPIECELDVSVERSGINGKESKESMAGKKRFCTGNTTIKNHIAF